jgi:hypothetical protein
MGVSSQKASNHAPKKRIRTEGSQLTTGFKIHPLVILTVLTVLGLGATVYYRYQHRSPKLSDKDTVVLAGFANSTGDSIFDDSLRTALAVQLEQSPFLNLLPDERIRQTLAFMRQPKETRLTPDLAREICQRTGSAAVLVGTIAEIGMQYLLTIRADGVPMETQWQAVKRQRVIKLMS